MSYKNGLQQSEYLKKYNETHERKKYPRKKRISVTETKEFLCFDGETVNNKYVLLGNSANYLYNKNGLSGQECFDFIWNEGKGKIRIIFGIHYDIQFWIKDFSDEDIVNLLDGIEVTQCGYTFKYFKKKFLKIKKGNYSVYLYDIISFFNSSFLAVIEKMQMPLTTQERNVLRKGKTLRSENFKNMKKAEIILYNQTECILAEKCSNKLRDMLKQTEITRMDDEGSIFYSNIYPSRFYGSGAIANKVMRFLSLQNDNDDKLRSKKFYSFITDSYFGGRFEIFKSGTFQKVYRYDINSAYPYVLSILRKPEKFRLQKINKKNITHYDFCNTDIYEIIWDFSGCNIDLIGILPFRRKDGYVLFPISGHGKYFGCECSILNHYTKNFGGKFSVLKKLNVTLGKKLFPENFIENIYLERRALKKAGNISEMSYKLLINSLYGKLAQQTGAKTFTSIYSASYITAYCRFMIMDTLIKNNGLLDCIQIATDGIFSEKKLTGIVPSDGLGKWSYDEFNKSYIIASGMYGLTGKKKVFALRGVQIPEKNFNRILQPLLKQNKVTIYLNAFIGHKFALANYKAFGNNRLQFTQIKRTVDITNYQKRFFMGCKNLSGINRSFWLNLFVGKPIEHSARLKKFDEDLEQEIIDLANK
jgi:hypothetical protein